MSDGPAVVDVEGVEEGGPMRPTAARKAAARKIARMAEQVAPWAEAAIIVFRGIVDILNNVAKTLGR